MRSKSNLFAAFIALVFLPAMVGFIAPTDRSSGAGLLASTTNLLRGSLGMQEAQANESDTPFAAYQQGLSVLRREYAGAQIDDKKAAELTYAAIRGMLFTLNDPFTSFLDRSEWRQMRQSTQGEFEGIGAVLEPFGRDVRVVRPIPGSPAHQAGLRSGDIILSVGAHNAETGRLTGKTATMGKDINEVVALIKGPKGTRVSLTVLRKGSTTPITFTLTRRRIEPPVVQSWMRDDEAKIGHIVVNEFNEKCAPQFDRALQDLRRRGMRALVFDLRFNPGGLLEEAVEMGSRFVERGKTVVILQETAQVRREFRANGRRLVADIPIVVLINRSSASASEIVAGAIKDHSLGTLVGEATFGKGLVQTLFPLTNDTALRLSTARYFTPSGRDISNRYDDEHRPIFGTGGVKPDVQVAQSEKWEETQNFEDAEHDLQLRRAMELLRTKLAENERRAAR
ncbi:MAG TPA: S41 family peptidase [Chthonomonadales bacterium]|nr:S41 family peptidase [Chthonomonadales bacterium]